MQSITAKKTHVKEKQTEHSLARDFYNYRVNTLF